MKRSTWILLVVFTVVLAGARFLPGWLEQAATAAATPTPTLEPTTPLFDFDEASIASISVSNTTGKQVVFQRNGDAWELTIPSGQLADSATIQNAVTQLSTLLIQSELDANITLTDFGFEAPRNDVTITLDDGRLFRLLVGKTTTTGRGYYVRLNNGNVVIVNQYGLDPLLTMVATPPVITPTVLPTPTGALTGTATVTP